MSRWLIALALVMATVASADPALVLHIVVNAKNPAKTIERRSVEEAFLKKRTRWDDDSAILPVDLSQKSSVRERFSHDMLGRDVAAVRRYWAQVVFSGRGVAPPELSSEAEVVKYVAAHPGAIGYVSAGIDLTGVKVIEVN
jgi:ABC-type phosphate transport system substrate-binding protein